MEQTIRRLVRRYRARERRQAGDKAATAKHPSRPWWTTLAGALALLIVLVCVMTARTAAVNPLLDSQIVHRPDFGQHNLEKAARVPGVVTLAWVGCLATVLMCAGIVGGRLLLSALSTSYHA